MPAQSLEMRINEIKSVESIQEGFINVMEEPSETNNGEFAVFILPQNTKPEENFCWVVLEVHYSDTYPQTMPDKLLLSSNSSIFPKLSK